MAETKAYKTYQIARQDDKLFSPGISVIPAKAGIQSGVSVIPAKAGIQSGVSVIPTKAGMTSQAPRAVAAMTD